MSLFEFLRMKPSLCVLQCRSLSAADFPRLSSHEMADRQADEHSHTECSDISSVEHVRLDKLFWLSRSNRMI